MSMEQMKISGQEEQTHQQHVQQQNQEQLQPNMQAQTDAQMMQGQVPQQPVMDMGGMEL